MSRAAEDYVHACTHAQVRGGTRALFKAIAELIPEGHMATPLIGMETLAAQARLNRRTVLRRLEDLIDLGEVEVIDGGQGRIARYTMVRLTGARPIVAVPLPLRANLQPAPRSAASRSAVDSTPGLFDAAALIETPAHDQTAINLRQTITSWLRVLATTCHKYVLYLRQSVTSRRSDGDQLATNDHKLPPATTYVRRSEEVEDARARASPDDVAHFLEWFDNAYATFHGGARCSIEPVPDGGRVDALLRRRSRDRLEAMTFALWRLTTDGVKGSDRWYIAERVPVRNIWVLHRKADFLDAEVTRAQTPGDAAAPPLENIWTRVLKRIEVDADINRHTFYTWFRETALVEDRGDVITVTRPGPKSELFAEWIPKHHGDVVRAAIEAERPGARVEFVTAAAQQRQSG